MNSDLGIKINRRSLLTSIAAGAALTSFPSLIAPANAAPDGVFRFASLGDAVIVTSTGLVETDPGLRHASFETRLAELARRLDQAKLQQKVIDRIAGRKSRCFALGSVTLSGTGNEMIHDTQDILVQQSGFVIGAFGALAIDDLPIFIATSIDEEDHEMFGSVLDVIAYITCQCEFWRDGKTDASQVFCVAPSSEGAIPGTGALDLITLWPLNKFQPVMDPNERVFAYPRPFHGCVMLLNEARVVT